MESSDNDMQNTPPKLEMMQKKLTNRIISFLLSNNHLLVASAAEFKELIMFIDSLVNNVWLLNSSNDCYNYVTKSLELLQNGISNKYPQMCSIGTNRYHRTKQQSVVFPTSNMGNYCYFKNSNFDAAQEKKCGQRHSQRVYIRIFPIFLLQLFTVPKR
ncbi:hypothetical protein HUJ05_009965 [Dendroctonus ponderosae]|nr:hypothetical protein HUJ05_009965 [Dendroctonus ponderosae]